MRSGSFDFAPLYGTARLVHEGRAPSYDPAQIHGVDVPADTPGGVPLPPAASRVDLLHPPFEILLFLPLTFLPYESAYGVWTIFNVAFLWLSLAVLWKHLPELHREFEVIAILYGSLFPLIVGLVQGQDSILLLFLLCLTFSALMRGHHARAGIFLALSLFKFHLVLPILGALLVARKLRSIAGFCLASCILLLLTFEVVGLQNTVHYIPFLLHYSSHISSHASPKTVMMPNLRGLISLAGQHLSAGKQSLITLTLSGILYLLLLAWNRRFQDLSIPVRYSLIVAVTSLISYHYYVYNSAILILPLLLMANHFSADEADPFLRRAFAAAAVSACATMLVSGIGLIRLETGMALLAIETIGVAGITFAVPYRTHFPVSSQLNAGHVPAAP
jgi:hypothetical protein